MLKQIFSILFLTFTLGACRNLTPEQSNIKNTLNKSLNIKMFDSIHFKGDILNYKDFKQKWKYSSVVYLKDSCNLCYPEFIKWHKKLDSMNIPSNYTVLFIIKGKELSHFISNVYEIDSIDLKYPISMDTKSVFSKNNVHIPFEILKNSVLIDDKNRIKLIGAPFSSESMKNLFFEICES